MPQPVVVELFTSQGCSSCPPADKYLGEIATRDDVIALSLHVNYWDYIGWPDPFASEQTTSRQRDYGRALKQRYVYTPELVVDGRNHSSRPAEIERWIREGRNRHKVPVTVRKGTDGMLEVSVPDAQFDGRATIWLAFYDKQHTTKILRGENRGRTLTHTNVVRELRRVGVWTGKSITLPLSMDEAETSGRDGCVVVLQQDRAGPILGAARMPFGR